jgi:3-hydroxyisobutyrate dehydrogenase
VKIGLIGPGRMGRPILDRLVADGHHVTALVRHPEAQKIAEADGVIWADSVAATVHGADAVFVVVLNDEQVRSVCLGANGAVAAMKRGATLIQHTTSDPATAQLLVDAGAATRVRVLDAALSGGPHDIAAARLTLWVGGDEADLEAMRPLLQTYASPILFVGPAGNGQRVKLVNNALFVAQVGLVIDAVRLAGSLGIEEQMILPAVQHGSGSSRALDIVARGSVDAIAGRLGALMQKDVTVVRAVAREAGVDLGIIGSVLSSDAVEIGVLNAASKPEGGS